MSTQKAATGSNRYRIRAVERALSILKLFIGRGGELSAMEISTQLELHRSTTFRFLATLMDSGFIEQNPRNGKYHLGVTSFELGNAFLMHTNLHQKAIPILESLRDGSGETIHLAVLEGDEVVYLEKLAGLHPIGLMSSRVGNRSPAYCTGLGKALLANLPSDEIQKVIQKTKLKQYTPKTITDKQLLLEELSRIKTSGYAVDHEEHEEGVMCVAAPVFDHSGVVASLSAAGPVERITQKVEQKQLELQVKEAAELISRKMGWTS
jgi:DNA-binding IclR family transcriptional regulator